MAAACNRAALSGGRPSTRRHRSTASASRMRPEYGWPHSVHLDHAVTSLCCSAASARQWTCARPRCVLQVHPDAMGGGSPLIKQIRHTWHSTCGANSPRGALSFFGAARGAGNAMDSSDGTAPSIDAAHEAGGAVRASSSIDELNELRFANKGSSVVELSNGTATGTAVPSSACDIAGALGPSSFLSGAGRTVCAIVASTGCP